MIPTRPHRPGFPPHRAPRRAAAALVFALAVTTGTPAVTTAAGPPAFPYEMRTGRETALLATGAGLLLAGVLLGSDNEPFTPAQLELPDAAAGGLDIVFAEDGHRYELK
jgi:hypothetical protein